MALLFRFCRRALVSRAPSNLVCSGAFVGLAALAMALSTPASAQTVTLRDPAFDLNPVPSNNNTAPWVPGFLRGRPLGLVVGIKLPLELDFMFESFS